MGISVGRGVRVALGCMVSVADGVAVFEVVATGNVGVACGSSVFNGTSVVSTATTGDIPVSAVLPLQATAKDKIAPAKTHVIRCVRFMLSTSIDG